MSKHARHVCFHCGLLIDSDEPELQVPPDRLVRVKAVRKAAGLRAKDGLIRYTHVDNDACFAAERKAAAW